MDIFWYLVLGHLVLDYPLQGDFLAKMKSHYLFILGVHALMWGLGIGAILSWAHMYTGTKVVFLVVGHMLIDWIKCHHLGNWCARIGCWWLSSSFPNTQSAQGYMAQHHPWVVDPLALPLWIDQFCHMIQLVGCLLYG